jgi:phage terminase large subunit-like protein
VFWKYAPTLPSLDTERREWIHDNLGGSLPDEKLIGDGQFAVHMDTSETTLVMGGNQSGKSVCSIVELLIITTGYIPLSLAKYYPREKLLCDKLDIIEGRLLCGTADIIHNTILPAFRKWTPTEALIDGSFKRSWNGGTRTLKLVAHNKVSVTIEMKTYKQDVADHQGPKRDFLFFDELPPLAIYRENIHRLQAAKYPKILIAATPTSGIASWIYQDLVMRASEKESRVSLYRLSSMTNPHTNLRWLTEILNAYNGEEAIKMRLFGDFISFSGFVYADIFRRNKHVIEPFPIDRQNHMVVRGLDPHWSKPAVCVEAAIDPYGHIYVIGVYRKKATNEELKADLAFRAADYRLMTTIIDCSLNTPAARNDTRTVIDELREGPQGIRMLRQSSKTPGIIDQNIRRIRKYLEDGKLHFFDIPEMRPMITAMETLERDMEAHYRGVDLVKELHQDTHSVLRYVFQLPLNYIPVEYPEPIKYREIYAA